MTHILALLLSPVSPSDLAAFPPANIADRNATAAFSYVRWLHTSKNTDDDLHREACRRAHAWQELASLYHLRRGLMPQGVDQIVVYTIEEFEERAKRFRAFLGPVDYYRGRMPEPIPVK